MAFPGRGNHLHPAHPANVLGGKEGRRLQAVPPSFWFVGDLIPLPTASMAAKKGWAFAHPLLFARCGYFAGTTSSTSSTTVPTARLHILARRIDAADP
jgi:hypothetical protein